MHRCRKNNRAIRIGMTTHEFTKAGTVKNVITKHECHLVVANKLFTEHKGLRQSVGHFLNSIFETAAEFGTIA
jgi:hypothetical protein